MNNNITGINQHPVALVFAFRGDALDSALLDFFPELDRHRADVTLRSAASYNHVVGQTGFAGKIDDDDTVCLIIIQ